MTAEVITSGFGSFGSIGDVILEGFFVDLSGATPVALVRVRYRERPAPVIRFDDRTPRVRVDPPIEQP